MPAKVWPPLAAERCWPRRDSAPLRRPTLVAGGSADFILGGASNENLAVGFGFDT